MTKTLKQIRHTRLAGPLCLALSISCNFKSNDSAPAGSTTDRDAIENVFADTVEAANSGDLEGVLSHFADDVVLMIPEEVPIFGKKLIRPRLQELFDHSEIKCFFTFEEAVVSGDWAFARGYASATADPRDDKRSMKFLRDQECLAVLQKDSTGSWKIARLMCSPMYPQQVQMTYK